MKILIDETIYEGSGTEIMDQLRAQVFDPTEFPDTESYIWYLWGNYVRMSTAAISQFENSVNYPHVKGHLQMADIYGFTRKQRALLLEMMAPEYQELFMALTGSYRDTELSPEQIRDIVNKLPPSLSKERRQVVITAYQLVGKVNYFWGGKSQVLGWDSRWGTPMEVWAEGSSTTGSVRPFGLDCTGFIDWTLRNAGLPSDGHWYIGTNLTEVSWDEALPGDIALFPDASHVGIVVGRSVDGGILVCHCSYSQTNVVVTDCAATGFTAIGRPDVFD